MRPTRIDFVFALPAITRVYNHSERVHWTYLQKTIFFQLPNPNRKFFFQKIRKSWIFQNHLKNSIFQADLDPCKKLTFWTFCARKIHAKPRFVPSLPSIQPIHSKLILWKIWEHIEQYERKWKSTNQGFDLKKVTLSFF